MQVHSYRNPGFSQIFEPRLSLFAAAEKSCTRVWCHVTSKLLCTSEKEVFDQIDVQPPDLCEIGAKDSESHRFVSMDCYKCEVAGLRACRNACSIGRIITVSVPTESRALSRAGLFRSHISAESGGPEGPEEEEEAIDAGGASLDGKHREPKMAPSCLTKSTPSMRNEDESLSWPFALQNETISTEK